MIHYKLCNIIIFITVITISLTEVNFTFQLHSLNIATNVLSLEQFNDLCVACHQTTELANSDLDKYYKALDGLVTYPVCEYLF